METTWAEVFADPSGVLGGLTFEFTGTKDGTSFAAFEADGEDAYAWRVPHNIETPEALRGTLSVGAVIYTGAPTLGAILTYHGEVEYALGRDHGKVYLFKVPPASVKTG